MLLPLSEVGDGAKKRDRMALFEAAIGASLSHPNIAQTLTYSLRPVKEDTSSSQSDSASGSKKTPTSHPNSREGSTRLVASAFEVKLVMEFCDKGSLRDALDKNLFVGEDGRINYLAILDTAADIACGMAHLHASNILHSDLKVDYDFEALPIMRS